MAVTALLKLAGFTNVLRYVYIVHQASAQMQPIMSQYPLGFGQWLQALAYVLPKPREIAVFGDPDSTDTQALLSVVRDGYRPSQVVALGPPRIEKAAILLLRDRGLLNGQAAAYVCDAPVPGRALSRATDLACQAPITNSEALQSVLKR